MITPHHFYGPTYILYSYIYIDLNHFIAEVKKYNLWKSTSSIFVCRNIFVARVFEPKAEWENKFRVTWRSTMQIKD